MALWRKGLEEDFGDSTTLDKFGVWSWEWEAILWKGVWCNIREEVVIWKCIVLVGLSMIRVPHLKH